MNKTFSILIVFFALILCYTTHSQGYNKSLWTYGAFGEFIVANHITDFSALPGVPNCCPKFTGGHGTGFAAGLLLQYRFYAYNNLFLRAGLQTFSSKLIANEPEWVIVDDKLTPAMIEHYIYADFTMPFIEPMYKYNTISGFSVSLGLNMSYLMQNTYSQKEVLKKPAQGTFENGQRIRNVHSGTLQGVSPLLFLIDIASEYEFELDKYQRYILTPRFSFNYGLNSLFKDEKWRITYFSVGLSFKYNPFYETSNPLEPKLP